MPLNFERFADLYILFHPAVQEKNTQEYPTQEISADAHLIYIYCFDSGSSKIVLSKISSNHFEVISSVIEWHISFYCNISLQDGWGKKTQQE